MSGRQYPPADDTRPRGGERKSSARVCTCTNHLGKPKTAYKSRRAALNYAMHATKHTGLCRIYRCPMSGRWHVTTRRAS